MHTLESPFKHPHNTANTTHSILFLWTTIFYEISIFTSDHFRMQYLYPVGVVIFLQAIRSMILLTVTNHLKLLLKESRWRYLTWKCWQPESTCLSVSYSLLSRIPYMYPSPSIVTCIKVHRLLHACSTLIVTCTIHEWDHGGKIKKCRVNCRLMQGNELNILERVGEMMITRSRVKFYADIL